MCGIFGYVGKKENNTAALILEGLKRLEYRGYDSWGIAIKQKQTFGSGQGTDRQKTKFLVEKYIGKIGGGILKQETINQKSSIGIGHTRWATHGGVTVKNAHPHLDCTKTIAVVHNGIVENYNVLKERLLKAGHKFLSETDTEVIPHLIEENLKKGKGFSTSVRDTFNELDGLNAIVVANTVSKEIIAAKNGSPLVVGIVKNGLFIASDAVALLNHTKKMIFLGDREMAILGENIKIVKLPQGEPIKKTPTIVDWKIEEANLGKFPHFMLKEIYEQPKVIRYIAQNHIDQIQVLTRMIEKAKGTFLIGAGTAFHACLVGCYLFSKISKRHINTAVASEFNYLEDFLTKKSLIIAFSQSGETIDVVEPLNRAKEKGARIAAVTNVLGSTIYRMADFKLLLGAGPEKAVASTKAYIAKLSVFLILAFTIVGRLKEASVLLIKAADEVDRLLDKKNIDKVKKLVSILNSSDHIYTIGRGISYPTALEAALKIKEVSYVHAEGLAGGELKHGTIALISKNTPCLVFAPKDETYNAVISNAIEIKSRGGLIIGIGPENSSAFNSWIEVKDLGEASTIAQIVIAQLLGYYLAVKRGHDPDKPRNLAKSVTVK